MSIWGNIRLFVGKPIKAGYGVCALCHKSGELIDLGDGDKIHHQCWNDYIPSYGE